MHTVVDRDYVREHPSEIIRTFGLLAYIRTLGSRSKGLLEQMTQSHLDSGIALPGPIGDAYRLSAVLELRAARIYAAMARRFADQPLVRAFFEELQEEEEEHGRLMLLCLHTAHADNKMDYVPSVRDPQIRALLRTMRNHERNAWKLSLEEALALTEELEAGEVNVIFDRLLAQTSDPQSDFFVSQLAKAEGHAAAVPKRIKALREKLS
jgi:hypothetical protein